MTTGHPAHCQAGPQVNRQSRLRRGGKPGDPAGAAASRVELVEAASMVETGRAGPAGERTLQLRATWEDNCE
ncbi:hypothetical protein NDU88_002014 [Pleurodeles waltl]|uniref:Uncharacterized protein n=1 Tax=Pleurodeles waltl TaxID=8319 RepID=A0AAV7WQE0_PLEWA|nr:hypothetical protein NDU88_002014 [Pleurodeles waltl]